MNFQAALDQVIKPNFGCVTARWLDGPGQPHREQILATLDLLPKHTVWRAAQLVGCDVSASMWSRHFQGTCGCAR